MGGRADGASVCIPAEQRGRGSCREGAAAASRSWPWLEGLASIRTPNAAAPSSHLSKPLPTRALARLPLHARGPAPPTTSPSAQAARARARRGARAWRCAWTGPCQLSWCCCRRPRLAAAGGRSTRDTHARIHSLHAPLLTGHAARRPRPNRTRPLSRPQPHTHPKHGLAKAPPHPKHTLLSLSLSLCPCLPQARRRGRSAARGPGRGRVGPRGAHVGARHGPHAGARGAGIYLSG